MGKRPMMKKPAAAEKKLKPLDLPATTEQPFKLEEFVAELATAHSMDSPPQPAPSARLKWASCFDGMNTASYCLGVLCPMHEQMFGAEQAPGPTMWSLSFSRPKHLFQDQCIRLSLVYVEPLKVVVFLPTHFVGRTPVQPAAGWGCACFMGRSATCPIATWTCWWPASVARATHCSLASDGNAIRWTRTWRNPPKPSP